MEERVEQPAPLGGKISRDQLDLILGQIDSLPTLPVVVARVLELSAPIAAGAGEAGEVPEELVRLIERDPSLTARVLSLANTSSPARARTAAEAVAQLGCQAVRSVALTTRVLVPPVPGDEAPLDGAAFWEHCLAVASAAKMLARHVSAALDGEEAFTAGLLHDLGKIALAWAVPKSYARAWAAAGADNRSLADHERSLLGVDHLVVGRRLAQRWNLPRAIELVLWLHHQPGEAVPASVGEADLIRIVALADAIARRGRIGRSGNGAAGTSREGLSRLLGLSEEAVRGVAEALPEEVARHARILGLHLAAGGGPGPDALADANEELGRQNEQLRRRVEALETQAEAFGHFTAFAAAMRPDEEVPDFLHQVAGVFLAALDPRADGPPGPVVAYAFDSEETAVLAVRREAAGPAEPRRFLLAAAVSDRQASAPASSGAEPLAGLLIDGEAWNDWVGESGGTHQQLSCAGQWLGGVLLPAGQANDVCGALASVLGTALGIVRQRCRADALSEELAGAIRRLGETQDALTDARTLAAVEDIATGAAHELNNPLSVVSGRAQLMRGKARSDRQRRAWQTIADQAQRISDIVADLMEFARPAKPNPTEIDVAELLTGAGEAFSSSDHPQARASRVDIEMGEGVPAIRADREQMHAAIVELITNAANAGASGARIRLTATADEIRPAVLLTVEDDGPGMDEATVARACTPFFSAQTAGRRQGLGLPKARRYVENNGGRMWIDSRLGEGTTVTIRLPGVEERQGRKDEA